MKRALLLQGGTMRGAYLVGVMRVFYDRLGLNYFDAIYSSSVGIFEQVFFAADQPETMENTWREYVHGRQLINFWNIFRGRPILDLDYLINLFQSHKSFLMLDRLAQAHSDLFCFVNNYETGEPHTINLKNEDIFQAMKATCALPFLYNKPVFINGVRYSDGLPDKNELKREITELSRNFDEVIVVINYRMDFRALQSKNVRILKPSRMPLYFTMDTNRGRIIKTIDQGKKDALDFLKDNLDMVRLN